MRHNAYWSGILDLNHLTAAALAAPLWEALKELPWQAWMTLGVIAIAILLMRLRAPERAELFVVYIGNGTLEIVAKKECVVRAPEALVSLKIEGTTIGFPITLPLLVEVAGRTGIVLLSLKGAVAYAVSALHTRPDVLNSIPSGRYIVQLSLPNGSKETWTLWIGAGCFPRLEPYAEGLAR